MDKILQILFEMHFSQKANFVFWVWLKSKCLSLCSNWQQNYISTTHKAITITDGVWRTTERVAWQIFQQCFHKAWCHSNRIGLSEQQGSCFPCLPSWSCSCNITELSWENWCMSIKQCAGVISLKEHHCDAPRYHVISHLVQTTPLIFMHTIWNFNITRSRRRQNSRASRDFGVGPEFGATRKQPIIPGNLRECLCASVQRRSGQSLAWLIPHIFFKQILRCASPQRPRVGPVAAILQNLLGIQLSFGLWGRAVDALDNFSRKLAWLSTTIF